MRRLVCEMESQGRLLHLNLAGRMEVGSQDDVCSLRQRQGKLLGKLSSTPPDRPATETACPAETHSTKTDGSTPSVRPARLAGGVDKEEAVVQYSAGRGPDLDRSYPLVLGKSDLDDKLR